MVWPHASLTPYRPMQSESTSGRASKDDLA